MVGYFSETPYWLVPRWRAGTTRTRGVAHARGVAPSLAEALERHVDLYQYVQRNVRLPIPRLGIKDVADYFGAARIGGVAGGFDAKTRYDAYRATGNPAVRKHLIDYNLDDVDGLIEAAEGLRRLVHHARRQTHNINPSRHNKAKP